MSAIPADTVLDGWERFSAEGFARSAILGETRDDFVAIEAGEGFQRVGFPAFATAAQMFPASISSKSWPPRPHRQEVLGICESAEDGSYRRIDVMPISARA